MTNLALLPHHDGSALYVANQKPKLGDKVKLRIRIHSSFGAIKQVMVHQSDSGEGFLTPQVQGLCQAPWLELVRGSGSDV